MCVNVCWVSYMFVYVHSIQCTYVDAFLRGRFKIFMWVKMRKNMTTIIKIIISTVCSDLKNIKRCSFGISFYILK